MSKRWAIIDLDGTLSDCSARVPLALAAKACTGTMAERSRLWDCFHDGCGSDPMHYAEFLIVDAWLRAGHRVAWLTGRPQRFRANTQHWLAKYGLPEIPLLMRPDCNHEPADVFKQRMLTVIREQVLGPYDQISFAMEDQDKVVAMWRRNGITCLQPRSFSYGG